jgi:hypothetical protein
MAAAAIASVQAVSSPASAHDTAWEAVWRSGYAAAHGRVTDNHGRVWSRDAVADNSGARTWYYYWGSDGYEHLDYVGDPNGATEGAGTEWAAGRVSRFQVCVGPIGNETCTHWFSA